MGIHFASATIFLAFCAAAAASGPLPEPAPGGAAAAGAITARIDELTRQLGDDRYEARESATKQLAEIGHRARAALERAAKSADPEVAFRAVSILERLPKLTHTLVDALGQPIPLAEISLTTTKIESAAGGPLPAVAAPQVLAILTEDDGRFGLPAMPASGMQVFATVFHPEFGRARCEVGAAGSTTVLRVPLVRRGTDAHQRAVTGQLLMPEGAPAAGAVVKCSNVRTPGEGLIDGAGSLGEVLTGDDGRFAYYFPDDNRNRERGELIPLNSRYQLSVTVPGDDSIFPSVGRYANVEPVRIVLQRAHRHHRFRFEAMGGGWMHDTEQLKQVRVQYDGRDGSERILIDLGADSIAKGRKLIAGTYTAEYFANGKTIEYLPLTVTDDSPEELSFELPHAVTYRGRVFDGVTGKPMADSFVMSWRSTSRNNLALLTAEDWKLLRDTPSNPPADHAAMKRLGEFYGISGLVRTDSNGRFEITRQPDQEIYGILAFDEDRLPFKVPVGALKPDAEHRVDTGDFPMFPAAKILVRPVFGGERLSVMPRWLPEDMDQPEWFGRFQAVANSLERQFEYVHWLTLNESQPVFVPAGVRLRVRFETPYDDQWAPAVIGAVQQETGTTKEIGDLHFAPCLPVAARVVDRSGKPVEGVPVRRMHRGEDAWCVAHNTDGEGLARFHVHPDSEGRFWVSDIPGPNEVRLAENLFAEFKVGAQAPAEPITITITDTQITSLLGAGRGRKPK